MFIKAETCFILRSRDVRLADHLAGRLAYSRISGTA